MLLFATLLIFLIALVIIHILTKKGNRTEDISKQSSAIIIRPTITVDRVREVSTKEIAPDFIDIPLNKNYYETVSGGIGYLNHRTYQFTAKFIETNHMRTREIREVFEDCDIKAKIYSMGYTDPISFEPVAPESATERQMEYIQGLVEDTSCIIRVPLSTLSKADASGIIYYLTKGGHTPSGDIMDYATKLHIPLSYLCPDWLVFTRIFETLSLREKIAFFIFCVHRDKYKPSCDRPDNSPYREIYYSFADRYIEDARFLKSFKDYYHDGHQLVRFGFTTSEEYPVRGGSKQTIAYKAAIGFLDNNV